MSVVLETREQLLDSLREAALDDVEQLTCNKERAAVVMTDMAIERNAALFASKPEVGLQEFVDAQDEIGGKFAAYVATVGDPFLVNCAALEACNADYEDLAHLVGLCGIKSLLWGDLEGCTDLIANICAGEGIIRDGVSKEENKAAADKFFGECLAQAIVWALSTKDRPATIIAGDATPGVTH